MVFVKITCKISGNLWWARITTEAGDKIIGFGAEGDTRAEALRSLGDDLKYVSDACAFMALDNSHPLEGHEDE